jgi:acetyltransferase-like isoleucine patch superfamily enzyme
LPTIEYEGGRLEFAALGHPVTLHPHCVFIAADRIHLRSHVIVSEFTCIHGGRGTAIGSFVHVASHSSIAGGGACILEDFVGLSTGVRLITGSEMVKGEGLTNPTVPAAYRAVRRSFVHLGRHAFLATNVIVHPGVTIGEGAVVGSGSVVTRDVEPWTINLGSPARPVGRRESRKMKTLEACLYETLGVEPFDPAPFLALKRDEAAFPEA